MSPKKAVKKNSLVKAAPKESTRRRTSGKQLAEDTATGAGSSRLPGQQLVPVKQEQEFPPPPTAEQRKMIAKLHYQKKTGPSDAFNE